MVYQLIGSFPYKGVYIGASRSPCGKIGPRDPKNWLCVSWNVSIWILGSRKPYIKGKMVGGIYIPAMFGPNVQRGWTTLFLSVFGYYAPERDDRVVDPLQGPSPSWYTMLVPGILDNSDRGAWAKKRNFSPQVTRQIAKDGETSKKGGVQNSVAWTAWALWTMGI